MHHCTYALIDSIVGSYFVFWYLCSYTRRNLNHYDLRSHGVIHMLVPQFRTELGKKKKKSSNILPLHPGMTREGLASVI